MSKDKVVTMSHNSNTDIPVIEFVFADGSAVKAVVGTTIRGMRSNGLRPINLRWYNIPDGYTVTDELRKWLLYELAPVFDKQAQFISNATFMLRLEYDIREN